MKIIGSDYDGTLTHGGIDDVKRQAIADWRAAGNIFAIVSGRASYSLHLTQEVDRIPFDYFIAYNGGIILNEKGEPLFERTCTTLSAKRLLKDLFYKWGFTYAHVFVDRHYVVKRDIRPLLCGNAVFLQLVRENFRNGGVGRQLALVKKHTDSGNAEKFSNRIAVLAGISGQTLDRFKAVGG